MTRIKTAEISNLNREAVTTELLEDVLKAELHAFRQEKSYRDEHCDVLRWWCANAKSYP
jgi:stress-induced morphogen